MFVIRRFAQINAVTEPMILYTIDTSHLQQFKQLAYAQQFPTIHLHEKLDLLNPFITTANIWFALKTHDSPSHKRFFIDETKRFAYSAAIFQLEYIERNRIISAFVKRESTTDDTLIILAYYLSYYVMDWVVRVMETVDENESVIYYLEEANFNKNMDIQHEDEHQRMQRMYLQTMIVNAKQTDDFQKAINNAIRDTHHKLNVHI
ncbi:hypothetical protein [Caryophanon latum]|uniref:Uncharacterized protein n=1 Tax=Caryophanon latum TaxID=33977 RepID=A0A1C0Z2W3_9BACL|nr:hypothetical protein [Caryophanon latum]OCS93761.1 hypothetical protein A6K76_04485 [Caryophanon latum]